MRLDLHEGITANPNNGGPRVCRRRYFRDHYWGLFVQHDWKASPYLTLTTGLRWECLLGPLYNQGFPKSTIRSWAPPPPGSSCTGAILTPHSHLWNSQWNNWSL